MSAPHDIADSEILVTAARGSTQGRLRIGPHGFPCALGRSGLVEVKREGDGGTPVGCFPLRTLRYRADRRAAPETGLPLATISPDDGWCDAPDDLAYNRPVRLPYPASAEAMWRHDHLYDLVVLLGHNDDPVIPGAGSAIFFHLAKEADGALLPTEGCVALRLQDMLTVLPLCDARTVIRIELD
ncbi:L,D-transpeptidase family protein [Parvibaculum sp.]|uniref:L,D-transpeptidase family protein n=1 Tax=Parvibaculum sp. TaxID=2024848 RepID=UPI001B208673|nr:L,D-transpeptidase family protein [Parvibaculum sp.]MBO6636270.1 L,D-transpeptidase family protein [Parvibaculum sp.]MBO6677434.1 L,D-transpeptidase family protein [Parvibaculum sp.]MBO6686726.1 L,D-transpeptidase family protein [Parvibaculum sp.]MBO6906406.1 L,D-transpeptidase family protein [Parvibaculum sp.]